VIRLAAILLAVAAQLSPSGTIRGVVLDAESGTPLKRVAVRLQVDGRVTVTDEQGRFELAAVPSGEQELYVSAVDFMLVKRVVSVSDTGPTDITIPLSAGTSTYTETVNVVGAAGAAARRDPEVVSERRLGSGELLQLRGLLTNDPMRAIQVLPGVATGDDFRSEFAVRGLAVPQMNFTFAGISSPFLVHTVQQVRETGSLAMVNGDVLDDAVLLSGAYPQRYGNRLGAELDFRMREGSRDRVQSHVSISTTDAALVVEGPLGTASRGSWLTSIRKSYLDLFVRQLYDIEGVAFGFEDAQAKFVYDVAPHHQLQLGVTAGESQLDRDPERLGTQSVQVGDNASAVVVATWRYLPSPRFSLQQRFGVTSNDFRNATKEDVEIDSGHSHELIYRADWTLASSSRVMIEGGGEARSTTNRLDDRRFVSGVLRPSDAFDVSSSALSAYAQTRWTLARGATVTPGVRIDHWTLTQHTAASPWVGTLWPLGQSLTLRAGAGLFQQDPGALETQGLRGGDLETERAWNIDAGLEGRLGAGLSWQATVYNREDRDRLRLPLAEGRVVGGIYVGGSTTSHYANALDGGARGVELVLLRRSPNGLSGWLSYAYGESHYLDRLTGETFWGDFDQRHTINLYGVYRFSDRMSTSARFRAGSNFPAIGYYREQDGVYFASDVRNELRVPYYARLDLRLNRTFTKERKRLTVYVEALNLLDRENVRFAAPDVNRRTLVATDVFGTMMPIVPSLGMLLEF
jgi:hypothetical protein